MEPNKTIRDRGLDIQPITLGRSVLRSKLGNSVGSLHVRAISERRSMIFSSQEKKEFSMLSESILNAAIDPRQEADLPDVGAESSSSSECSLLDIMLDRQRFYGTNLRSEIGGARWRLWS
ncbi:hypothetical protein SAMN05444166_6750 [Singulisphaera sp. GP187]|nr:hypothetical protein SAMN05444166_6750 [Singulisphaera sp. GP187]